MKRRTPRAGDAREDLQAQTEDADSRKLLIRQLEVAAILDDLI